MLSINGGEPLPIWQTFLKSSNPNYYTYGKNLGDVATAKNPYLIERLRLWRGLLSVSRMCHNTGNLGFVPRCPVLTIRKVLALFRTVLKLRIFERRSSEATWIPATCKGLFQLTSHVSSPSAVGGVFMRSG